MAINSAMVKSSERFLDPSNILNSKGHTMSMLLDPVSSMNMYTKSCRYMYIYVYTYTYTYIYIYIYMCIYVYIYIYIYTYIYSNDGAAAPYADEISRYRSIQSAIKVYVYIYIYIYI
jgi:hypothetical protein